MTFHLARHTFATTITLTNGVPIETRHYAKVIDLKVSRDMQALEKKLDEEEVNI